MASPHSQRGGSQHWQASQGSHAHCRAPGPSRVRAPPWPCPSSRSGQTGSASPLPTACALFSLLQSEPRKCCLASLPNPLYSLNRWEGSSPMAYIHSLKPQLLRSI